ncbi:MAG: glycosyl transferase [Chitinophagaceae bacterium]|nr:glycosyl transferase [Chitinophagaceae bacterium]
MKIFYAVQATGNGHISRAITLLPHLEKKGSVDVFLSGSNSHLNPQLPIRYRSKGISLYYNNKGGLDYGRIALQRNLFNVMREVKQLPVEKYDLVINDFDFITSLACKIKKIPSVHYGHQASFHYQETPRPINKSWHGELLLKDYVRASHHIGLHFEKYHPSIFGAIIKEQFLVATPSDNGHITVYLPALNQRKIEDLLSKVPQQKFEIFTKEVKFSYRFRNLFFSPIDQEQFNKSLITCKGIICGAGFETPAEAIQMGKKILAVPIEGQYEQKCNAIALECLGVSTSKISKLTTDRITDWLRNGKIIQKDYSRSISESLNYLFSLPACERNETATQLVASYVP